MHADKILTHVLGSCLTSLHAKQAAALLRATSALLRGNITSLTEIALCLSGDTMLKHRIKSVDRLLGIERFGPGDSVNAHLLAESLKKKLLRTRTQR